MQVNPNQQNEAGRLSEEEAIRQKLLPFFQKHLSSPLQHLNNLNLSQLQDMQKRVEQLQADEEKLRELIRKHLPSHLQHVSLNNFNLPQLREMQKRVEQLKVDEKKLSKFKMLNAALQTLSSLSAFYFRPRL